MENPKSTFSVALTRNKKKEKKDFPWNHRGGGGDSRGKCNLTEPRKDLILEP